MLCLPQRKQYKMPLKVYGKYNSLTIFTNGNDAVISRPNLLVCEVGLYIAYTLSASCVHTACVYHFCSRSFSQSSSQSSPTLAAPAWWRFSTSADRQRIETFLRRAVRSGLWESATTTMEPVNEWWMIVLERLELYAPCCCTLPTKSDNSNPISENDAS